MSIYICFNFRLYQGYQQYWGAITRNAHVRGRKTQLMFPIYFYFVKLIFCQDWISAARSYLGTWLDFVFVDLQQQQWDSRASCFQSRPTEEQALWELVVTLVFSNTHTHTFPSQQSMRLTIKEDLPTLSYTCFPFPFFPLMFLSTHTQSCYLHFRGHYADLHPCTLTLTITITCPTLTFT